MKKNLLFLISILLLNSCFQTEIVSPSENSGDKIDNEHNDKLSLPDTVWNLDTIWDINKVGISFSISAKSTLDDSCFLLWNHEVIERSPFYPQEPGWWSYNQDWDTSYSNEYTFTFDSLELDSFTVCVSEKDNQNMVKNTVKINVPACMPQISLNDSWEYRVTEYKDENDSVIYDYSFTKTITVSAISNDFPDSFTVVDTYDDGRVNSKTIHSSQMVVPLGGEKNNKNILPTSLCNYRYKGSEGWIKQRQLLYDDVHKSYYFHNRYASGGYGYGNTKSTKAFPEFGITYFFEGSGSVVISGSHFRNETIYELIKYNDKQF